MPVCWSTTVECPKSTIDSYLLGNPDAPTSSLAVESYQQAAGLAFITSQISKIWPVDKTVCRPKWKIAENLAVLNTFRTTDSLYHWVNITVRCVTPTSEMGSQYQFVLLLVVQHLHEDYAKAAAHCNQCFAKLSASCAPVDGKEYGRADNGV
eukprot:TRINITY_DN34073_c0_g1_i1.p1 TRINITY_DN34073_c0_g1~~TRINITY_DN34073_c0_g1_i1.p1  ORF type:complete len:160 (-),score=16.87 TRINITY_DN34073_c0_g1_i1:155-610(-)